MNAFIASGTPINHDKFKSTMLAPTLELLFLNFWLDLIRFQLAI